MQKPDTKNPTCLEYAIIGIGVAIVVPVLWIGNKLGIISAETIDKLAYNKESTGEPNSSPSKDT